MVLWTRTDLATRRIISSGQSARIPKEHPGSALIVGVRGDSRTQRATADFRKLEQRPTIGASLSALTTGELEPITLTLGEPAHVFVNDGSLGVLTAGETSHTIAFEEAGVYDVQITPASPDATTLPRTLSVAVTEGGTPAPADITVRERRATLAQAARAKLAEFDVAITRAETREADAAAVEAAAPSIADLTQAKTALGELARIQKQTNNDLALIVQHLRRAIYALVEITTRGRE
jgi:hypothetical protein